MAVRGTYVSHARTTFRVCFKGGQAAVEAFKAHHSQGVSGCMYTVPFFILDTLRYNCLTMKYKLLLG